MQPLDQTARFELKGQWWRPEGAELIRKFGDTPKPSAGFDEGFARLQSERDQLEGTDLDHACRGPLTFDPESGLRLSLLGSSEIAFPEHATEFAVHGLTSTGVPCSLLDCFVTNSQKHFPSGFADREILGHTLLCGAHTTSLHDIAVDRLVVRMAGLLEFLWAPVHAADGKAWGGLGHKGPEQHTTLLPGADLTFAVGERRSRTARGTNLERTALVQIALHAPAPLDECLQRWIEPLVRFVTFATNQPTITRTLTATIDGRLGVAARVAQERQRAREVHVVQQQRRLRTREEARWERMLISHAAVDDHFDAVVAAWWNAHEQLAGAGDFLFGALRDPMGLEPKLVTLTSALEGYHRAFHGGLAMSSDEHQRATAQMLDALADPAEREFYGRRLRHGNEFLQQDRLLYVVRRAGEVVEPLRIKAGRLAEVVVATRNYFVHLGPRDQRVLRGAQLYEVNELLIIALKSNLLLDLGVTPERALEGVKRAFGSGFVWRELTKRGCAWPKSPSAR